MALPGGGVTTLGGGKAISGQTGCGTPFRPSLITVHRGMQIFYVPFFHAAVRFGPLFSMSCKFSAAIPTACFAPQTTPNDFNQTFKVKNEPLRVCRLCDRVCLSFSDVGIGCFV